MPGAGGKKGRRRPRPRIRRKNLNIDQGKLDRAREILGVKTETEAVDQALSLLLFREELVQGIREVGGTGGVENYFDGDSRRPIARGKRPRRGWHRWRSRESWIATVCPDPSSAMP